MIRSWILLLVVSPVCTRMTARSRLSSNDASAAPHKVAVIGCGIGGGSFSHYFHEKYPEAEITAFESRDYIGGRLKHTHLHEVLIELGGDAWSKSANPYVVELAKTFPPKTPTSTPRHQHQSHKHPNEEEMLRDPLRGAIAVWDGNNITDLEEFLAHLVSSDFRLGAIEAEFLSALHENYNKRGGNGTFSSIEEFVADGDLAKYTSTFANISLNGVKPEMTKYFLNPMTRVIYHQDISTMHGFGALVSITSLLGADSYADGNSALVERLFTASAAAIRTETTVTRVDKKAGDGGYAVAYTTDGGATETTEDFDAVIVVSAAHYSIHDYTFCLCRCFRVQVTGFVGRLDVSAYRSRCIVSLLKHAACLRCVLQVA
eukprot:m.326495 g.326495  ORF g.326495 m.326495 type:complete len:374 (-) comp20406_c0_seq5:34-1155(-)